MDNQIEIVKNIADGMIGIGGVPSNEDFYLEFNHRISVKLGIKTDCNWKSADVGMFGFPDRVYITDCGKEFDSDKTYKSKFCSNCGRSVS